MIRAGVLSDTHLTRPDRQFVHLARGCFRECDVIIHAGDLIDPSILEVFSDKTVYAVCGNMCSDGARERYPKQLLFSLGRFVIGLTHGAGLGHDIEDAAWTLFPEADCIIYGHTHAPVCRLQGNVLFLNPGSFQTTSRYGAPGTYAIVEADDTITARIIPVPQVP